MTNANDLRTLENDELARAQIIRVGHDQRE